MVLRLCTVLLSLAVLPLCCAPAVWGQDDTLTVTIENVDDGPDRFPGSHGRAILIGANDDTVGVKSTDSTGQAVFSNLSAERTYTLEAYHNPDARAPAFDEEFWGRRDSISLSEGNNAFTFTRSQPFVRIVKIYADSTGRYIPPGRMVRARPTLRFEVTVENPSEFGASTIPVRPRLLVDQGQSTTFDHDRTATPKELAPGERFTFEFLITPLQRGPYYVAPAAQVETATGFIYTDSWDWRDEPHFVVNRSPTAKRGSPVSSSVEVSVSDYQEFRVRAKDPDGNLKSVEWQIAEPGGDYEPAGESSGLSNGSGEASFTTQFETAGEYRVAAIVYDDYEQNSSAVWTVIVTR